MLYRNCLRALLPLFYSISFICAAPTDLPSAASFWVKGLPDLHQDPAHPLHIYSGHISSDPHATTAPVTAVTPHIFFVMVKNRRTADKERVIFWFNGGPGCSSFDGLMMEVGPWRVDMKGGLKLVAGGWEEYTTMVYVDQPPGTGYSYTSTNSYIHTLEEASEHVIQFLRNFYMIFPEYRSMDTYLAGESFAGQYIPYFADAVLNSNLNIPLLGAVIGNGWIDARRQYPSYVDYAVKHGILEENSEEWKAAKKHTDHCQEGLAKYQGSEPINVKACEGLLMHVLEGKEKTIDGVKQCMNIYDVRYMDTQPACGMNWPPDISHITTYLDRKDVVRALHAQGKSESWIECNHAVHANFHEEKSNSSVTVIPRVLAKIPMLIFAGDQDFICNYMGLESMIQAMTWNGATGLGTVQTESWSVNNHPAGTWVSSRNLTYTKLFNASHMAPYDVPDVAHDMILRFMGVNFSAITDGSAKIPSSVGTDVKPVFLEGVKPTATPVPIAKTPQQNKAMWEAYYNAGSAALVLVVISLAIGVFLWCRIRNRRVHLPVAVNAEESIPLNSSIGMHDESALEDEGFGQRKGKERAQDDHRLPVFGVGDDEDEDGYKSDTSRRA